MRITQTGPIRPTTPKRRGYGDSDTSTGFTKHLTASGSDAAVSHAGSAAPANSVDALFAIQEVQDATGGAKQARQRGEDILDRLDEIRHDLLMGTLSPSRLEALGRMVKKERVSVADPRIMEVLDEIELRAAVELAKYSVRRLSP